ncbi:MAG: L-seryl-tRNA(Sec) selenium transferase [Acidobacteriota bacterium]|nr:MAG: L-seryl-tRNA(Sec) selenium transferase [Acidobacteriota bacterium]
MKSAESKENEIELRDLPSVDLVMKTRTAEAYAAEYGRERTTRRVRSVIEGLRSELSDGAVSGTDRDSLLKNVENRLAEELRSERSSGIRRVVNATGVIIHTNLGRAPLSAEVLEAISEASGYCDLEYDLETGKRGRRGRRAEELAAELTGAEEALIVNNCAAAAVLVLTSLCEGGEAVISRGELVEIGGDFRVPDVMERSGAKLVEIGTTNRTKLEDYEKAVSGETKLLLKVHPSNYRIVGFTSAPSVGELAELAHSRGLLLYEDAGSGALVDLSGLGLDDEPLIRESIAAGADVVTFSGDKLLGSIQSGFIVGKVDVLARIRRHPLYRAFRPSKIVYAALESTLVSFLRGTMFEDVPALRMLALTGEELAKRAADVAAELKERLGGIEDASVAVIDGSSVVGGGSAPASHPSGKLIAVRHASVTANELEKKLRGFDPPVIARIENDAVVLDLRTVDVSELEVVKSAVCEAFR